MRFLQQFDLELPQESYQQLIHFEVQSIEEGPAMPRLHLRPPSELAGT